MDSEVYKLLASADQEKGTYEFRKFYSFTIVFFHFLKRCQVLESSF